MGRISTVGVPRAGLTGTLIAAAAFAGASLAGPDAHAREAGTIVGIVTTKEAAQKPIRVTIDPAVCGQTVPDESILVDGSGRLANVVLSVPGVKAAAPAEVVIANDKCRFVPRVSLLQPKGMVKATSHDATLHTMHAAGADGRAFFNVSIPMPKITISRPLDRVGVATLTCSTHTWMRGFVHVTDELSAVSAADGSFRLENVPPGTHQIRVWHETLKAAVPLTATVTDGQTTTVDVTMIR